MANEKYSTIQQHEPLRVPTSFDASGRRLIAQLEEIFDDIYRRFGRLNIQDLSKPLGNKIIESDTMIHMAVDGVTEGESGVGQVHNASLDIDTEGISMKAGKISMEADTEMTIKSGGSLDIIAGGKGNISLTEGGGSIDAETGTFTYLNVNGQTVGGDAFFMPVKTVFTENAVQAPDTGKPYLWVNSLTSGGGSSEVQISVPAPYWQDISHSYSGTFNIGTPANQLDGTEFSYKVSFGLTHRNSSIVNVQVVYIRISDGTNYVSLQKTVGGNHRAGDIMNINAEITGQTVNLFNGSALTAQIMFSGDSALNLRLLTSTNVPFLLTGKSNSGGGTGVNDTEIKWVTEVTEATE